MVEDAEKPHHKGAPNLKWQARTPRRPWKQIALVLIGLIIVIAIIGSLLPDDPELSDSVPRGLSAAELATMEASQYEAWLRAHDLPEDVIQERLANFPTTRSIASKSIRYNDIVNRIDLTVRNASTGEELWNVCTNIDQWVPAVQESIAVGQEIENPVLIERAERLLDLLWDAQAGC